MPRGRRFLIVVAIVLFVLATALSFNAFGSHSTEMHIFGIIAAGWAMFSLAFIVELVAPAAGCSVPGCPEDPRYEFEMSSVTLIGADGRRVTWPASTVDDCRMRVRLCDAHGEHLSLHAQVFAQRAKSA